MGLSDNEIQRLPPEVANFMQLVELDVSRNGGNLGQVWGESGGGRKGFEPLAAVGISPRDPS